MGGEYWIVKSDAVKIQARYMPTPITHGLSVTKEIAVSGSFINDHKLRISATTASWDGQPILAGFPSTFNNADPLVDLRYDDQGILLQSGREGKALHVVHATLPGGVSLQVNRWNEAGEGDQSGWTLRQFQRQFRGRQAVADSGACGHYRR